MFGLFYPLFILCSGYLFANVCSGLLLYGGYFGRTGVRLGVCHSSQRKDLQLLHGSCRLVFVRESPYSVDMFHVKQLKGRDNEKSLGS